MTVHSPLNGVVVLNTIWLEGRTCTVQTGDQVRPGVLLMAVVERRPELKNHPTGWAAK